MLEIVAALLFIAFILVIIIGFSAAFGAIFWLVWNATVVVAFGWPALTFWQAWGIWFLLGLVLGMIRRSRSDA